jgi:DNA-directed RNA polymerase specialized sigma24 family protein
MLIEIEGHATQLGRTVSTSDLHRRLGTIPTDDVLRRDDADSLDHALRSLSPQLRTLCRQLTDGSAHAAARELNTSRRQVRNAIRTIRGHLKRAGFGILLGKRTTRRRPEY